MRVKSAENKTRRARGDNIHEINDMRNRSGFAPIIIIIAVVVALAVGGGGYYVAKKRGVLPQRQITSQDMPTSGSAVYDVKEFTAEGEIVCAPHRSGVAPTKECRIGLKTDDQTYYLLEDPKELEMPRIGSTVLVNGALEAGGDANYQVAGVIVINSISLSQEEGSRIHRTEEYCGKPYGIGVYGRIPVVSVQQCGDKLRLVRQCCDNPEVILDAGGQFLAECGGKAGYSAECKNLLDTRSCTSLDFCEIKNWQTSRNEQLSQNTCNADTDCVLWCSGAYSKEYAKTLPPEAPCTMEAGWTARCVANKCTALKETASMDGRYACTVDTDCTLLLCSGAFNKEYAKTLPPDNPCLIYEGYAAKCVASKCAAVK